MNKFRGINAGGCLAQSPRALESGRDSYTRLGSDDRNYIFIIFILQQVGARAPVR